jgi:hypothetical protein
MARTDEADPIADSELLYRRIPAIAGYYDPQVADKPSPQAFRPRPYDATGLSFWRAKHKTIEEVARGQPGRAYYVAIVKAADLRNHGMTIVPRGDPGHAEIPELTYETRKDDRALEFQKLLAAELCLEVTGPFETEDPA